MPRSVILNLLFLLFLILCNASLYRCCWLCIWFLCNKIDLLGKKGKKVIRILHALGYMYCIPVTDCRAVSCADCQDRVPLPCIPTVRTPKKKQKVIIIHSHYYMYNVIRILLFSSPLFCTIITPLLSLYILLCTIILQHFHLPSPSSSSPPLPLPLLPLSQDSDLATYCPNTIPRVPSLIVHCVKELEDRGLNQVGLYRVPG